MNSRLLLGVVAFGVSFGINLALSQQPVVAAEAGLVTLPAVYLATAIVDRLRDRRAEQRSAALKTHILVLQQRRQAAYQAFTMMLEEKERVAMTLNSLQLQLRQLQLAGEPKPQALLPPSTPAPISLPPQPSLQKPLSWNLAEPKEVVQIPAMPAQLPLTQIQDPATTESPPPEALVDEPELAAKARSLRQEVDQLQTKLADNRQTRDRLTKDIADLKQQKRKFEAELTSLQSDLNRLEQHYSEAEKRLATIQVKNQELSSTPLPLQASYDQLQKQVTSLQAELQKLDTQVSDRHRQKQTLEQQVTALQTQHQTQVTQAQQELRRLEAQVVEQTTRKHKLERQVADLAAQPQLRSLPASTPDSTPTTNGAIAPTSVTQPKPQPKQPTPSNGQSQPAAQPEPTSTKSAELPDEWMEFLNQLPDYELEVLRAIVEQNNPAPLLKRIAEENLTMPELLIDTINERALETVGDLVIDAEHGANSAKIAREHLKAIKKLLRTYEFLIQ